MPRHKRGFSSDYLSASLDIFTLLNALHKHAQTGIRDYLVHRLYDMSDTDIDFTLPQLCSLLLSWDVNRSYRLSEFLITKCSQSIHLSLKVLWILQAHEYYSRKEEERVRVRDLIHHCEMSLVNASIFGEGEHSSDGQGGNTSTAKRLTAQKARLHIRNSNYYAEQQEKRRIASPRNGDANPTSPPLSPERPFMGKAQTGYCFGYAMSLLRSDGSVVLAQNVLAPVNGIGGDVLMGGDGTPVRVTQVVHAPQGPQRLWTLRMKDYVLNVGGLSTHDDVVVTDTHLLELVSWRRASISTTRYSWGYYWHHFRLNAATPWVAVPPGDTRVWTGEYSYRRVTCVATAAASALAVRDAELVTLRLNFRGVRWSVTVRDYVAQLLRIPIPWPKYDGLYGHIAPCGPAPHYPTCRHPHDHGVPHARTWWALYQPASDQPTQFDQHGGPLQSLHARILRLFGAGTADPWAAPDAAGQPRWLQADTDDMAWLIGLWLADGEKSDANIAQTEVHADGTNDHAEACEGIRQLASLVARLRANPGTPRAALPPHAGFWTPNEEGWLARHPRLGPTGNILYRCQ